MISLGGHGELGTKCNLCSPAWCWFQGCTITPGFINSCRYSKCHCKHAHVCLNVRTIYLAWIQLPYSLASRCGSFVALLTPTSLMSRKPKPPEEKTLEQFSLDEPAGSQDLKNIFLCCLHISLEGPSRRGQCQAVPSGLFPTASGCQPLRGDTENHSRIQKKNSI